jgi:type II secretion system F domain protein
MSDKIIMLMAVSIVVIIGLLFVLLFKTPETKDYYISSDNKLDPSMKKLVRTFGPDVLGLTSKNTQVKMAKDEKLDLLMRRAGNPWNLTVAEFYLLKATLAALGLMLGLIVGFIIGYITNAILGVVIAIILPLIGWLYPTSTYENIANQRDMEFKKSLPEAIDLLIMAMSGGNFTLINGIREIIPHLPDSPIREEFIMIAQDVDAGMSVTQALENFALRAPTDGIKAFVKALINANRLSVDMTMILQARARESRKELRDEAEKRIAALPLKVMGVMSPGSAIAIMAIAIAPSIYFIVSLF